MDTSHQTGARARPRWTSGRPRTVPGDGRSARSGPPRNTDLTSCMAAGRPPPAIGKRADGPASHANALVRKIVRSRPRDCGREPSAYLAPARKHRTTGRSHCTLDESVPGAADPVPVAVEGLAVAGIAPPDRGGACRFHGVAVLVVDRGGRGGVGGALAVPVRVRIGLGVRAGLGCACRSRGRRRGRRARGRGRPGARGPADRRGRGRRRGAEDGTGWPSGFRPPRRRRPGSGCRTGGPAGSGSRSRPLGSASSRPSPNARERRANEGERGRTNDEHVGVPSRQDRAGAVEARACRGPSCPQSRANA